MDCSRAAVSAAQARLAEPVRLAQPGSSPPQLTVCMVCDFFVPQMGGIETHINQLSRHLLDLGYRIIVVTHDYGILCGRQQLHENLIVYYLPLPLIYSTQNTVPSGVFGVSMLYSIFCKEKVDLVHGHSAYSTLCHEAILTAKLSRIPTVYTDHSLIDEADWYGQQVNRILRFSLAGTARAICVSHACRDNFVQRTGYPLAATAVIPHATDTRLFQPAPELRPLPPTVVVVSRLYWQKGIDLLAAVIPLVCSTHPQVRFVIGGDGPKRIVLEQMRENYQLQDRVDMLGNVSHENVPAVLNRAHVFLNCSLTEAFCMALLEAACCGLVVVSSNVGGVQEVLPEDMRVLVPPTAQALAAAVLAALPMATQRSAAEIRAQHQRLAQKYAWQDVAEQTAEVYQAAMGTGSAFTGLSLGRLLLTAIHEGGLLLGCFLALITLLASVVVFPSQRASGSFGLYRR